MVNKDILNKLINMDNEKDVLDFFEQNNINLNDENFKNFLDKFKKIGELDEDFLVTVSGGTPKSFSSLNALKLTGFLFLAVGGGFAAGSFYSGSKNKKEADLLSGIGNYWKNVVDYNSNNASEHGRQDDIQKLNRTAMTNMAQIGRHDISEILNNPELYSDFMGMFSQSPDDIINYKS